MVDILGIQLSLVTEAATTSDSNEIVDRVLEHADEVPDDAVIAVDKHENDHKIPTSLPVAEETIGWFHLQ